jgi:lysylphosphatidylglycerol synthetase-like protein (DUF2156 family)
MAGLGNWPTGAARWIRLPPCPRSGAVAEVRIEHPNREKAESKATKAIVTLLLVVSALLVLIITLGGWSELQGAIVVAFAYVVIFLVMAYYVHNWNRGVLPVAAVLSVLLAVIAAVSAPAWFDRDKAGFDEPALGPDLLGLLTAILVPVLLLLLAFSLRGFAQKWNVEVETQYDDYDTYPPPDTGPRADPAGA